MSAAAAQIVAAVAVASAAVLAFQQLAGNALAAFGV